MAGRTTWLRALALTGAVVTTLIPAPARAQAAADEGIPVESELVKSKCGGCHRPDASNRMSRISYRRASPENWERTIERMIGINHAAVNGAEARAIVKYLADRHGLAPEEARPAAFEYERRLVDFNYTADTDTGALCQSCHSFGRVMSERRTSEEWGLLVAMHRGYFPLVDNQPMQNGQGFRRSRALAPDVTDKRQPMEKAIAHLAKTFPLVSPEWSAWTAASSPAALGGRWAVVANVPGKGPAFGEMTVTADGSSADTFVTRTTLTMARTGETVSRTGKGLLYTGFQWRGRGFAAGTPDDPWREVMFVERNRSEMWGRWFTGAYDETGVDVKLTRLSGGPVVLGTGQLSVKRGTASATLQVFGANLPAVTAGDIGLGQGVTVVQVLNATPGAVSLQVSVAADAVPGPRDVSIAGTVRPAAFVVYDKVDGIRVLPRAGLARTGGAVYPKQLQQFEAMAFANGPDNKADTEDDWPLGLVDAKWGLEEYTATFADDDLKFVGAIDAAGLFTPNLDGPNGERSGNRNNIGDVWVVADYTPPGAPEPIRTRAHLLVAPPVFMRWMASEVGK
ncbi:MAG TPA: quinohemoprotein amine dehydrogenase subunit alpha [Vicinamibacterales bacterium]|nr:quinohemoprotein amine dehydrogenase subunit alpha [Vicinamibacterales bacterium]